MTKLKIIILIMVVVLLSGCNKTYTCTYKNSGDDNNYESIITYKVKDNIIVDAHAKMIYKDEKTASYMCEVFKYANDANDTLKCDGKVITIDDYQKSVRDEDMTQDEFITYLEQQKFDCND